MFLTRMSGAGQVLDAAAAAAEMLAAGGIGAAPPQDALPATGVCQATINLDRHTSFGHSAHRRRSVVGEACRVDALHHGDRASPLRM
jgi:hypothetical protein